MATKKTAAKKTAAKKVAAKKTTGKKGGEAKKPNQKPAVLPQRFHATPSATQREAAVGEAIRESHGEPEYTYAEFQQARQEAYEAGQKHNDRTRHGEMFEFCADLARKGRHLVAQQNAIQFRINAKRNELQELQNELDAVEAETLRVTNEHDAVRNVLIMRVS